MEAVLKVFDRIYFCTAATLLRRVIPQLDVPMFNDIVCPLPQRASPIWPPPLIDAGLKVYEVGAVLLPKKLKETLLEAVMAVDPVILTLPYRLGV